MNFKLVKYKILSCVTFGATRMRYKVKYQQFNNLSLKSIFDTLTYLDYKLNLYSNVLNQKSIELYKREMVKLKLFDEEFYVKSYPSYKKYNLSPIEHYIKIGWQLRYNPSTAFSTSAYLVQRPGLNECPLIHFLREGRYNAVYGYVSNPYPVSSDFAKNKNNNKVVYTCIVGDYDGLMQQVYIAADYDYICFTDNESLLNLGRVGHWEIRPLVFKDTDPTRINRYHKLNPHKILSEYDESIYIDANINILSPFLFDLIAARNTTLLVPIHFSCCCPYQHAQWILKDKVDYAYKVNNFLTLMRMDKFPCNYGMTENNIIYRNHKDPVIIKIMDDWWTYVRDYCKRDQLSFSYVLWKNNIRIEDICFTNARSDIENFLFIKHDKRRPDVK